MMCSFPGSCAYALEVSMRQRQERAEKKTPNGMFFLSVFELVKQNHKSHLPVNSFESLMLFLTIRFLFNEFTAVSVCVFMFMFMVVIPKTFV